MSDIQWWFLFAVMIPVLLKVGIWLMDEYHAYVTERLEELRRRIERP